VQVPQYRRVSLEEFHRPIDSRIATNVQAPFTGTGKKPGDLDLLIAHPTLPHEAIAIECKRVKITVESAGNDHLNKIEEVATGVKQQMHCASLASTKPTFALSPSSMPQHSST